MQWMKANLIHVEIAFPFRGAEEGKRHRPGAAPLHRREGDETRQGRIMNWTESIDGYCERVDPSFWAEPVNAVTNAAFLVAALVMLARLRGARLPLATALAVILFIIGVGSFLFHTYATPWAALVDVLPIMAFAFLYIFMANRDFWGLGTWAAIGLTLLYIPYAAAVTWGANQLPFFEISSVYWSLPLMVGAYGAALMARHPALGRGLLIGAGILCVSLTFRSLDYIVCPAFAVGTHFAWHILNAIMLGWMIEVYRRHMVATRRASV